MFFYYCQDFIYKIVNYILMFLIKEVDDIIKKFLDMWLVVSQIKFECIIDFKIEVDILIKFVFGYYGDGRLVDGLGKELVYVFFFFDNKGMVCYMNQKQD